MLLKLGHERLTKELDIKTISRQLNEFKQLINLIFDERERILFRNQRALLLEERGSEESSSQDSSDTIPHLHWDKADRRNKYAKLLTNWTARSLVDKRLLYGVLQRNGAQ